MNMPFLYIRIYISINSIFCCKLIYVCQVHPCIFFYDQISSIKKFNLLTNRRILDAVILNIDCFFYFDTDYLYIIQLISYSNVRGMTHII